MFLDVNFFPNLPDTPEKVLKAYSMGVFPMGNAFFNSIDWFTANPRGIISLNDDIFKFNVPRSVRQIIKKNIFEIKIDTCFSKVIGNCSKRHDTWITKKIKDFYIRLHKMGYAHSVEAFYEGKLAGGLYGVALHGAFFGESMFYSVSGASKVAVVKLYEMLKKNCFTLFDIQIITPVFKNFNAILISQNEYMKMLNSAMLLNCRFQMSDSL
jgi:leucyl/phenylalanyl-tRNA--protein transferase